WDFGNGITATMNQNYMMTYSASQTYTICLTITIAMPSGETCVYTLCKDIEVDLKMKKSSSTSQAEEVNLDEALLYPNPSSTELNLELNSLKIITAYTITNANGQEVISKANLSERKAIMDVSHLPIGIYFIAATDKDGKIIRKRFIKE
ncbi:MAG TPA: T9SS type A sorting domain-containing protein, partial [Chitinophagaceae bacterium]|nr:T9SS type A sorting domain-containing protein [Chitinophagaceae bacterium]